MGVKANEIRLGNHLTYKSRANTDELFEVTCGDLFRIDQDGSGYDGIQLIEEWLAKFGFDKKPLHTHHGNGQDWLPKYPKTINQDYVINNDFVVRFEVWHYISKQKVTIDYSIQILYGSEWYENITEYIIQCDIKYVHQLQNLYFALTGEELTIK